MAIWKVGEPTVELVKPQWQVLHYTLLDLAIQTTRGQERQEQSSRAPWQIQEAKDTVRRCCVLGLIHEQWQVNCHTTAESPRRRRVLTSTGDETDAVEDLIEVHHGVMHRYGWLEQVIHRALQNQVQVKSLFVVVSRMGARTWQLHV